jgi:hypothetical protein
MPADGVPCDMTLKLACGAEVPVISQLLQVASPFFRGALDDMKGSAPIPVSFRGNVAMGALCTALSLKLVG